MSERMPLTDETRVILLLCGRFGLRQPGIKPLTQGEYHGLDQTLRSRELTPGNLLGGDAKGLLSGTGNSTLSLDRLSALLDRRDELDHTLDAWEGVGIWVLGERDHDYPLRLRERLVSARPPLLFGTGPREFLDLGGICIVGSRDSPEQAMHFSRTLGQRCGQESLTVISSDMRGVDRETVSATLDAGGRVIVALSDSLEKAVVSRRHRDALENGRLTLVTPFSPDARFSVANAMRVNRYQYALSDTAVIVETRRKGGIWSGAEENRKEGWVPAFVRVGDTMSPGNMALRNLGLFPISQQEIDDADNLNEFFVSHILKYREQRKEGRPVDGGTGTAPGAKGLLDLYSVFLTELQAMAADTPCDEAAIISHFGIEQAQARAWLKRAESEGRIKRLTRPLRFLAT